MNFTSYAFLFVFLPLLRMGWRIWNRISCKNYRYSNVFLLLMSAIFVWGGVKSSALSFVIFLCTIVINWTGTYWMRLVKPKISFWIFFITIAGNIGILVFLKYTNWIRGIFDPGADAWNLLLPLGISFYTLEQIIYLIDCYRNKSVRYGFLEYSVYSTFFPVIASGPILRHDKFIGQLRNSRCRYVSDTDIAQGLASFCLGMGKKVIVAAQLGKFADYGYQNVNGISSMTALLCIVAYSLQLYFDFSGYCNIAEGIAQMLGFELPQNFDSPYKSGSIGEFWKKWHMTLTVFLTQYIYIPLGGNRNGTMRQLFNIMCVFLISGFWHGASWCFVLWGVMHGIFMMLDKVIGKCWIKLPQTFRVAVTFCLVSLLWVPFRSHTLSEAITMYKNLFQGTAFVDDGFWNLMLSNATGFLSSLGLITYDRAVACRKVLAAGFLFVLLIVVFKGKNVQELKKIYCQNIYFAIVCGMILFFSVIQFTSVTSFIYEGF